MGLRAKEIALAPAAAKALERLEGSRDPGSASIGRRIRALKPILLGDCLHGDVVKKAAIPRPLSERYGLENLFVEDLPSVGRLLYAIVRDRGERYLVIVEVVDHRTFSRWFPGRGR